MKSFIILVIVPIVLCKPSTILETKEFSNDFNKIVDEIFANISNYLIHHGSDPIEIPDIKRNISYKPFFITYHGEFELTNGWLEDASTIHRDADVNVVYNFVNKKYEFTIPLAFKDLISTYQYKIKIMNLGPSGQVSAKVTDIHINLKLSYDDVNYFQIEEFSFSNTGRIKIKFIGHPLVDWLVNLMSDTLSFILHPLLVGVAQNALRVPIEESLNLLNEFIDQYKHKSTITVPIDW